MDALLDMGFSNNEAAVYVFLLQNGTSYAPQIQTALDLEKMPTYRALTSLRARGYVTAIGETRNQQFVAAPLETLLEEHEQRAQRLTKTRNDIEALARALADQQHALYTDRRIKLFEGTEGYRLWNEERLQGDTDLIREFGRQRYIDEFFSADELEGYVAAYIKRRTAKRIPIRVLSASNEEVPHFDRTDKKILKQSRVVEIPTDVEAFLSVFGSRFGFYTKQSGRYVGVIIDDPMMARMMSMIFDVLWETGEDV